MQDISNRNLWVSAKEYAERHGVTSRRVRILAAQGRIMGAILHIKAGWMIPTYAQVKAGKRGPSFGFRKRVGLRLVKKET